ncbi:hypothetical protein U1Q18_030489 [Sarracenia purpurea var. burkii]
MADGSKDLLNLENRKSSPAISPIESKLLVCKKEDLRDSQNLNLKPPDGLPLTSSVPASQVLGQVKDFLGLISEANKRLQNDAKDDGKDYDIEVLTGKESEYIEMDLMLGVADLHTPEAVAAAESAIAGHQPVISLPAGISETESEDSSDDSSDESDDDESDSDDDDDGDCLMCSPAELKKTKPPGDGSSVKQSKSCKAKKKPKIVELS